MHTQLLYTPLSVGKVTGTKNTGGTSELNDQRTIPAYISNWNQSPSLWPITSMIINKHVIFWDKLSSVGYLIYLLTLFQDHSLYVNNELEDMKVSSCGQFWDTILVMA
jgi:hypothetical protein